MGVAGRVRGGWRLAIVMAMAVAGGGTVVLCPAMGRLGAFGQNAKAGPDAKAGTDAGPGAKKGDDSVGSYSLVTTVFEASAATHLLSPAITIQVDGGTERAPGESAGEKPVPAQYTIESFGAPWYECTATVAKLRGCEALDRDELTIRDPNTIGYHIVSHGGAATLSLNVVVHDILPVSHGSAETPWHAGEVIFVAVPKATPAYRFSSEVLVGEWNGEPIVFEVGKPLPEAVKKGLEDLGVKQDLGDRVLFGFRVKGK